MVDPKHTEEFVRALTKAQRALAKFDEQIILLQKDGKTLPNKSKELRKLIRERADALANVDSAFEQMASRYSYGSGY